MVIDGAKGVEPPHHQAARGVPLARHADHDVHQQAGSGDPRPHRAARRNRRHPADRVRAGNMADWPRALFARHLPHGRRPHLVLPNRRRRSPARLFDHRRLAERGSPRVARATTSMPLSTKWNWCAAPAIPTTGRGFSTASARRSSSVPRSATSACASVWITWWRKRRPPAHVKRSVVQWRLPKNHSPASYSRSRRTWIRVIATAWRFCACVLVAIAKACACAMCGWAAL